MPDEFITPMARLAGHDYFIHEPAMLRNGALCVPVRWFTRVDADGKQEIHAKCWELRPVHSDSDSGWRVVKRDDYVLRGRHFLKNFPELQKSRHQYGFADFAKIRGKCTG